MTRPGFLAGLRRTFLMLLLGAAAAQTGFAPMRVSAESPASTEILCEYGITLALAGQGARAESVFISLLSRLPGDARALNNLGNLALLNGDPESAERFYRRAAEADSADPGVDLNRATALSLLGDETEALRSAEFGVTRAGGVEPAASLLGIFIERDSPEEQRGSRKGLSREEALQLLRIAAGKVPPDSTRVKSTAVPAKTPSTRWRLAGPRSSDADEPIAAVYWKR